VDEKGHSIEVRVSGAVLRRALLFAIFVRSLLAALVLVDYLAIMSDPSVPSLYRSGVRFKREPKGTESFVDLYEVLKNGGGDCAHLAAWRCAELRAKGERATLRVTWQVDPKKNLRVFHVVVRREDQSVEDPSALLGMRSVADSVAA
jgi:hypothetical protein